MQFLCLLGQKAAILPHTQKETFPKTSFFVFILTCYMLYQLQGTAITLQLADNLKYQKFCPFTMQSDKNR
jgi:hypothetical protein